MHFFSSFVAVSWRGQRIFKESPIRIWVVLNITNSPYHSIGTRTNPYPYHYSSHFNHIHLLFISCQQHTITIESVIVFVFYFVHYSFVATSRPIGSWIGICILLLLRILRSFPNIRRSNTNLLNIERYISIMAHLNKFTVSIKKIVPNLICWLSNDIS